MKDIKKYCVNEMAAIKEAVSIIQNNLSRCVIVLNDNKKVVGVFSEGDVLRAIMQDIDLHTPLKKILSPTFLYLKEDDMAKAYGLVKKYGITLVPVIDDDFRLQNVITIYDVMEHLKLENGR
jgi:CBS domain-containing protein